MWRSETAWMINCFKGMIDNNLYDPSSDCQVACAQFCLMRLIQKELDLARMHWNTHMIHQSKHAEIAGRPDQMYYLRITVILISCIRVINLTFIN